MIQNLSQQPWWNRRHINWFLLSSDGIWNCCEMMMIYLGRHWSLFWSVFIQSMYLTLLVIDIVGKKDPHQQDQCPSYSSQSRFSLKCIKEGPFRPLNLLFFSSFPCCLSCTFSFFSFDCCRSCHMYFYVLFENLFFFLGGESGWKQLYHKLVTVGSNELVCTVAV